MTDAADNPELLSLRYVDIDTLAAWDRNAKKHDFGALVESIVRHGFRDPPAYDSALNAGAGGVAEGNGRADALRMMRAQQMQPPRGILLQDGQWFAPVLFGVDAESQAAAEAYAVAHNNLTMSGGDFTDLDMAKMWDSVGYAELLASLAQENETPVTVDESALDALLAVLLAENTLDQTLAEGDDFGNFAAPGEGSDFVQFKCGDYVGRVSRAVYDSFDRAYKQHKQSSTAVMLDDVLRGWLHVG